MEIIKSELEKILNRCKTTTGNNVSEEMSFNYLTLWYYFLCDDLKYKSMNKNLSNIDYNDIQSYITDGANDGGIDYVYFDDDTVPKVYVCQSKYTDSLDYNSIIAELNKMCNTVEDFFKSKTSNYNSKLKRELQNALDSLPEQSGDIEYILFTKTEVDSEKILKK